MAMKTLDRDQTVGRWCHHRTHVTFHVYQLLHTLFWRELATHFWMLACPVLEQYWKSLRVSREASSWLPSPHERGEGGTAVHGS